MKYYYFECALHSWVFKDMFAQDRPRTLYLGKVADRMKPMKVVHYMFQCLGGIRFRYFKQPSASRGTRAAAGCPADRNARKLGYLFIKEHGPRANNANQFVEWTDDRVNNERGGVGSTDGQQEK